MHGLDRGDDVGGRGILEQKPGGSGLQRAQHQFVSVEGSQDDDLGRIGLGAEQPGRGDAVEERHADIHQHDVGMVQVSGGQYFVAVAGFADDLHLPGSAEHHLQP